MTTVKQTTVRIFGKTMDEVEDIVYGLGADISYSPLVHGRLDGSVICVSGEGDVLADMRALGLNAELYAF